MIRKLILAVPIIAMLWSCDKKEREALQAQNDSLRTELQTSQMTAQTLQEIGDRKGVV